MRGRQLPLIEAGWAVQHQGKQSTTFVNNMSLPIHRWYRFPAGFFAHWVADVIRSTGAPEKQKVFDPFAGSGTVMLESERCGAKSIGIEAHPFIQRIAKAKLLWRVPADEFEEYAFSILEHAKSIQGSTSGYPRLIRKCYPEATLAQLDALKTARETKADSSAYSELAWLALVAILRPTSPVGTAPWQYVLPKKSKVNAVPPFEAFDKQVTMMVEDMTLRQLSSASPNAEIHRDDARVAASVPDRWATLLITSPPYANNYDYADATRLEMSFLGEVRSWGDLQEAARKYLIVSCTQHVSHIQRDTLKILESPELEPIQSEIREAYRDLAVLSEKRGGRKAYHRMIAMYFYDMAKAWQTIRQKCAPGCRACFVIGDSAPYGVHVPTETWLGELALAAGFKAYSFEKVRDRNIKWKGRKHTVPLQEGRLWVQG